MDLSGAKQPTSALHVLDQPRTESVGARSALTQAELGIWLGQQAAGDEPLYTAAQASVLRGEFDIAAFSQALDATLREATALHVRFAEHEGLPERQAIGYLGPRLTVGELEASADVAASVRAHAERRLERPLAIDRGELYAHELVKMAENQHVWLHFAHHVALDGYGFNLIERRVAERYTAAVQGRSVAPGAFVPHEPVQLADVAYQGCAACLEDRDFFRAELARVSGVQLGSRSVGVRRSRRWSCVIGRELSAKLREAEARLGASWSELVLAGVAKLVSEWSGEQEFALGLPVMLRLGTPALRLPAMVMNISALPVFASPDSTLPALARQLHESLARQKRHQRYRYEQLKVDPAFAGRRLFGPVVNIMPFGSSARFGACTSELVGISAGPVEDLSFAITPHRAGLELMIDAHPESFSSSELSELASAFVQGLDDWLDSPERELASFSRASSRRANPGNAQPPWAAVREVAQAHPDAPALIEGDSTLSYAELEQAVRGAARELRERGLEPGQLVALDLARSVPAIVLVLAALSLGAGYAALDPRHPRSRREQLVRELEPKLLVSAESAAPRLVSSAPRLELEPEALARFLARGAAPDEQRPAAPASDDTAYVVFTSGSTGEPKGVEVGQHALAHFVAAAREGYGITSADRVLQFAPLSFDASVEEIWVTLSAGATLVLRDDAMLGSMSAFLARCAQWRISVLDLPTAFWHELALALALGEGDLQLPSCVRLVIIGGEAALASRLRDWQRAAPQVRLLNTYGPAEATVVSTFSELGADAPGEAISIGTPLRGVQAVVVSARGAVERGAATGELYLAGPTLARGYFKRPDLTRQRFVSLPGAGRAYRTGDLVSRSAEGELTFVGRVDDELKISGYRVAPAEVEAALARHASVTACAVLGASGAAGKYLVAHVEVQGRAVTAEELRRFLVDLLPAPMVPSVYEFHDRLPRAVNGKLDRASLRQREQLAPVRGESLNSTERRVVAAWSEVLGAQSISLDDDFFSKGGSSLQVIQLANRLNRLGAALTVAEIFRHPTPRAQARLLEPGREARKNVGTPLTPTPLPAAWFPPRACQDLARSRVLLTGASGFVGMHLLERLLSEPGYLVVCPVRARDRDQANARLWEQAKAQSIDLSGHEARIQALPLDLLEVDHNVAGLAAALEPCSVVLHAAAQVSLTRDYASLWPVNVCVTRGLVGLTALWGAEFHLVSTIATVPQLPAGTDSELFFPEHSGLRDGYQRSKWQAEWLCEQASQLGLRAAVHRLGRITGSRRHARINPTDLVWRVARSASKLGAWPALDVEEPWMPADVAADTIVRILLAGGAAAPANVYNLVQSGAVHLTRLHTALEAQGQRLEALDVPTWLARLREVADDEDRATLAFFELNELENRATPAHSARAHLSSARVTERVPSATTEPVSNALIAAYCESARELGLLRR